MNTRQTASEPLPASDLFGLWVPISSPPPLLQEVLLWGVLHCQSKACHKGCRKATGRGYEWFESVTSSDGYNRDDLTSVTHWMPLPSEPNSQDQTREPKLTNMEPPIENNAAPSVDVPRLVRLSVGAPAQAKLGTSAWFASLAGVHQMTTKNGLPIIARFEQREDGRVICRARINLEAEWEAREAMDDTCDAISMCAGKLQRAVDGLTANVQAVEPMTMTRKEAIKELKLEQENGDTEAAHGTADDVLCNLLIALGYEDVVDEYNKVDKRYA